MSGPFLSLCDQIARQNNNNPTKIPIQQHQQAHTSPTGFAYYNGPQFQTIHQFSGPGPINIPVTGETMKASAQLFLNPG